jgi:hypothetical protein
MSEENIRSFLSKAQRDGPANSAIRARNESGAADQTFVTDVALLPVVGNRLQIALSARRSLLLSRKRGYGESIAGILRRFGKMAGAHCSPH